MMVAFAYDPTLMYDHSPHHRIWASRTQAKGGKLEGSTHEDLFGLYHLL